MNLPWSVERPLPPEEWKSVRLRLMFDCCKWDIQSEDHCVAADFPLILDEEQWKLIASEAEQLSREVLAAEGELLSRPDLHRAIGIPRPIRRLLRQCVPGTIPLGAARVMRFDFHFTREGWRISEVNADVPGGFIEASGFTEMMSEYYPAYAVPPNPAKAYVAAVTKAAGDGTAVALVHATAHYDDCQVMQYLAQEFHKRGTQALPVSPAHLKWQCGYAEITGPFLGKAGLLVRFFPAEWLPNLRLKACWGPWFRGGNMPMSNPGTALLIQSKRFPIVWSELRTSLTGWRALLPETNCPTNAPIGGEEWVFKPVFGRAGEDVGIAGVTETREYKEIVAAVRRAPSCWVAQKRFDVLPLETECGPRYVCLGVFTVDGEAVGAYGRISGKPLIDQDAQDIAVLCEKGRQKGDG